MFTNVTYTFEFVSSCWRGVLKLKDETLTGLEIQVLGEIVIAARENVLNFGSRADDLFIARYIHRGRLTGAVEDSENGLSFVLTGDDIDTIVGDKLCLRTFRDNLVALTPVQQSARP